MLSIRILAVALVALVALACERDPVEDFGLAKGAVGRTLSVGQKFPHASEASTVGTFEGAIERKSRQFRTLVRCSGPDLVFKNEEQTDADQMMTGRLCDRLRRLSSLASQEWPDVDVRVTDAWDERGEHAPTSVHYEGRAADITTSDLDARKLGRLSRLAVDAGFDWVFYEDRTHVHVSVQR